MNEFSKLFEEYMMMDKKTLAQILAMRDMREKENYQQYYPYYTPLYPTIQPYEPIQPYYGDVTVLP